jgi:hypothetical protein
MIQAVVKNLEEWAVHDVMALPAVYDVLALAIYPLCFHLNGVADA